MYKLIYTFLKIISFKIFHIQNQLCKQNKVNHLKVLSSPLLFFLTKTFSNMTEAAILKALSNVQEPDLGKDLVTLNMVQDIVIDGNNVSFTIVLNNSSLSNER
jgi:hypothetical protein